MDSRRFWWVAGIGVALLVLALFLLWGGSASEITMRKVAMAAPRPPRAAKPRPKEHKDESRQAEPAAEDEEEELPPQIQRFLEANVYPPTSGRLTKDATDLLFPNQRYERRRPLDEDGDVTYIFTADRYYYTGDETALVWLEVLEGDDAADVVIHRATARPEEEGRPGDTALDLDLEDSGGGRWSTALDLARLFPDHHGTILLEVAFQAEGEDIHTEAIRIFTTPLDRIPAELNGGIRDSVRDGSLLVEVGVDVDRPGFFRFDANLYDRDGKPVAFAVFKGDLEPGENWLPLEFFGKVLRDQGAKGPYSIEQIRGYRFLEGQTPDRESLVDNQLSHRTSPYDPVLFSDEVYTSEHKERMVQLMLEDIKAGRALDIPPIAAPGD